MSSPEYAELRGIPGTAVAAKAQLYADLRKRSLLFFLHSLSVNENGLCRRRANIIAQVPHPERASFDGNTHRAVH